MSKENINKAVQLRYDELMQKGKHGHYETLFKVVHEQVQACEAEQSKRIAEMYERGLTYAKIAEEKAKAIKKLQAQNAELVEALEDIVSLEHIPSNFGVARTISRSALAKVKGE